MTRWLTLSALLLLSLAASAQTRIDLGVSLGQQPYSNTILDPRYLPGVDVTATHNHLVAQLAIEYADISDVDGHLYALHGDALYRIPFASTWSFAIGGGPSYLYSGESVSEFTVNGEAELAWQRDRFGVFGRVRAYDYSLTGFRVRESGPNGPAVYLGARWTLQR
ncbi:MAG: hypothetical protein JO197_06855 [Acidobacteria bacterium]|nr:hypothetical protein [Acidobacteriota bacterium]MBV9477573.1 hypothetical protein [Acidobacteriota bacterium]